MPHPGGQGGEEVHGQQERHHHLDHHGHQEGGDNDGDCGASGHGCGGKASEEEQQDANAN